MFQPKTFLNFDSLSELVITSTILTSFNTYQSTFSPIPSLFPSTFIPVKDRWSMIMSNKLRRYIKGIFNPKNFYWIPKSNHQLIKRSLNEKTIFKIEKYEKNEKFSTKECVNDSKLIKTKSNDFLFFDNDDAQTLKFSLNYEFLHSY